MHSLTLYTHSIESKAISKITVDLNCPDVDDCLYNIAWFPNALTVNAHPLVFTVRAAMCVYSDSLDLVIDFTPHFTLRYNKNHGPVKLYNMQSLSDS